MTTDSIEATELKAGRSLDALVAEKIFGWRRVRGAFDDGSAWYPDVVVLVPPEHIDRHTNLTTLPVDVFATTPRYSTDIAAAMPIAEKLGLSLVCSEDGWYAIKPADIIHYTYDDHPLSRPEIGLVLSTDYPRSPSETPSLAICLEALRLTGGSP